MFKAPKSSDTSAFYDRLITGAEERSLWGSNSRFSPEKIASALSTQKHYEANIRSLCSAEDQVLDIGCSTGGFTSLLAKYSRTVVGVDLSAEAVMLANHYFADRQLNNCTAQAGNACHLDFQSETFDVIQMVDVVHHAEDPVALCKEAFRLLKPNGKFIVFEPNKYNVALWLMCLLDRNEWGALKLGSKTQYQTLFSPLFNIDVMDYNGLLIGPTGRASTSVADWLSCKGRNPIFASQSPKIFMVLSKR